MQCNCSRTHSPFPLSFPPAKNVKRVLVTTKKLLSTFKGEQAKR